MVIAGDIRANNWVAPGPSQAVRMIINAWPEFSQMRKKSSQAVDGRAIKVWGHLGA